MMRPKKKSKAVKRVGKTLKTVKQEIKTEKKETPAQLDKKKLKSSAPSTSWSDSRPSKARKSLKTLKAASSSSVGSSTVGSCSSSSSWCCCAREPTCSPQVLVQSLRG